MKAFKLVGILAICVLLTGCQNDTELHIEDTIETAQEKVVIPIEYEVPVLSPGVLVDQVGYEISDIKTVVFVGKNLSDTFRVISEDTGEVVFTGHIKTHNLESDSFRYYGTFTECTKEGNYYIETDVIGQSYPFVISDNVYQEVFINTIAEYYDQEVDTTNLYETALSIYPVLLAYELHPTAFTDDTEILKSDNTIPDIADITLEKIEKMLTVEEYESSEEEMMCAAVYAKYYMNFKALDTTFAKKLLQAAEAAYLVADADTNLDAEAKYLASTELYRATGKWIYRKNVEGYQVDSVINERESLLRLYGDICYLSTRQKVDLSICNEIISRNRPAAKEIVTKAKEASFFVDQTSVTTMLQDMVTIEWLDSIITSKDYLETEKNYVHFFLGCNQQGTSYIASEGFSHIMTSQITDSAEQNNLFLFLLSSIINKKELVD